MRSLVAVALVAAAGLAAADEVADLGAAMARSEAARAQLAQKNADEAREIDRLKAQPAGVARDYRLGQLLEATQDRAAELDRLQGEAASLRAKLVAACDAVIADKSQPQAARDAAAARRASLVERPSVEIARPAVDPLDGAQELSEKADLIKDSEDRLRREVERIGKRIDGVESRRRLRERAAAVDDDLFLESSSSRRVVRVAPVQADRNGAQTPASPNFAAGMSSDGKSAGAPGGTTNGLADGGGGETRLGASLRGALDPSLLDELRRAEAGQDLDRQVRALRKMQGSLRSLADDLARREADLRARARDIKPRK